jgi:orotate phosphoribosyltransferase-like protein
VGFNGVNLAATKSDLLDRDLIIRVERIEDKDKQKKGFIWQEFEKIRPQLLGYIFDILVKVLRMGQTISIEFEKLPRMADFAETAEIISRCMGNPDNQFMDAYYENIKLQTEEILETSLVAPAILKLISDKKRVES